MGVETVGQSEHRAGRLWRTMFAVVLGALAIVLALAGWDNATKAVPASGQGAAYAVGNWGQGSSTQMRVVDLKHLPQQPVVPSGKSLSPHAGMGVLTQAQGKTLPFRIPRGAEARAQTKAWQVAPMTGLDKLVNLNTAAPALIAGWNGPTSEVSGGTGGPCYCVPPDGDMAAGPNHVVVAVNQAFQVYNKTGTSLAGPIGFDNFFGDCGTSGLTSSDGIAAYDPGANRFIVGILRFNGETNSDSYMSLAVSKTSDPTGQWYKYCFPQVYSGTTTLYDFPHISVGQDALFTTGNVYPPGFEVNVSARINAYDKAAMYSGVDTATQLYHDVLLNSDNTQADTIRPVLFNQGLPVSTNYFINASSTTSRISVWRWTLPFSTNQFALAGGVDVDVYLPAVPMLQPPPGQPMPPSGYIDDRTLGAMYYNGTIYSTHTAGCNPGAGVTDCVQWYQVGNVSTTPTLIQQGMVGTNGESRAYPNIAVDVNGNVRLAYAHSSTSSKIGIWHTGRMAGDPAGTMGSEAEVVAGQQVQTGYNALRYGDYSGSVVDPDGVTFWHFEEYTAAINDPLGSWGTWVSAARYPAAATATSTSTSTATSTNTATNTATATNSATGTPPTATSTNTNTPTVTGTPPTATSTSTNTATNSATRTNTATVPPTSTSTSVPPSATRTSAPPSATATVCPVQFADVPADQPFYSFIRCLACKGVMSGYKCGGPGEPCNDAHQPYFRPGANITRGQLSKIVANSANDYDVIPATQQTYHDVLPGDPFWVYIERLTAKKVMGGYQCGGPNEPCDGQGRPYFRPAAEVTRGQTSKIVSNAFGFRNAPVTEGSTYHDVPKGSPFWLYVERLTEHGIMSGYQCGGPGEPCDDENRPYFRPGNSITRGQASKIVANTFYPNCQTR